MMVWLLSMYLLLMQYGLHWSADCPKNRLAIHRQSLPGNKKYRLCFSKEDAAGATVVLTIANSGDRTVGQINLNAPMLQFQKKDGENFMFVLSRRAKMKLNRLKGNKTKRACIRVNLNYDRVANKGVKISAVKIGDFKCTFPSRNPVCQQLNESCENYLKVLRSEKDSEFGLVELKPVNARLRFWKVIVGFDSKVNAFQLSQPAQFVSSRCNKIFTFKRQRPDRRGKRGMKRFMYNLRFDETQSAPVFSYIFYGNKLCNTSCGVKPSCSKATAAPKVSSTKPTTNLPPVPSTNLPPVPSTNLPPVPITDLPPVPSTNLPPVPITDLPPVPSTNLPPVPITNLPPVPSTNLPPVPITDLPPVPSTNLPPVPITDLPPVPSTNLPPVPITDLPPVPSTNLPPVPTTDLPPVPSTNLPPVPITDLPPVPSTNLPPEPTTDLPPVPSTNLPPEPTTDVLPEPTTDLLPEPSTDLPPEPITDLLPEPTTDILPEPSTDLVPEPITDLLPELTTLAPGGILPSDDEALYDIFDDFDELL